MPVAYGDLPVFGVLDSVISALDGGTGFLLDGFSGRDRIHGGCAAFCFAFRPIRRPPGTGRLANEITLEVCHAPHLFP